MDPLKHLDPPDIGLKSILSEGDPPALPRRQAFRPVGEAPLRRLESLWRSDSLAARLEAFTRPRIDDRDLLTPQGYETRLDQCIRTLERMEASAGVTALRRALGEERELRDLLSRYRKSLLQA